MAKAERWERVRATSEEIERWKAMARASGMPLSELVRQSIGRARAWSPDRAAIERDRTLQLARIGSNLNQVARWANARKSAEDGPDALSALFNGNGRFRRFPGPETGFLAACGGGGARGRPRRGRGERLARILIKAKLPMPPEHPRLASVAYPVES